MKDKHSLSPFVADFFEFKRGEGVIEVEFTRDEEQEPGCVGGAGGKINGRNPRKGE